MLGRFRNASRWLAMLLCCFTLSAALDSIPDVAAVAWTRGYDRSFSSSASDATPLGVPSLDTSFYKLAIHQISIGVPPAIMGAGSFLAASRDVVSSAAGKAFPGNGFAAGYSDRAPPVSLT